MSRIQCLITAGILVLISSMWTAKAAPIIQEEVRNQLLQAGDDQVLPFTILLRERPDRDAIRQMVKGLPRKERSLVVWEELEDLANRTQAPILSYLEAEQAIGNVEFYRSLKLCNGIQIQAVPSVLRTLEERPDIYKIIDDTPHPVFPPTEEQAGEGELDNIVWSVSHIGAPDAWAEGYTGEGVLVAVIDSGSDYNHPDLADHVWDGGEEFPNHGWDFANNDNNPMDDDGHGTHTAGSVCGDGTSGDTTGVAPNATLMILKVSLAIDNAAQATIWAAMDFALQHQADVTSMSLGYFDQWNPDRQVWRENFDLMDAGGVVNAVATGNEGGWFQPPICVRTPGNVPSPWRHPDEVEEGGRGGVISVGATSNTDLIANFSSYGPVTWENVEGFNDWEYGGGHVGMICPDVVAPGVAVRSLNWGGGYRNMDGTSMATPHVAGLACLMLSRNPDLLPVEVDSIMQVTALELGAEGKDNYYGSGRIQCFEAVDAAEQRVGSLQGRVTDAGTGEPIPEVWISTDRYGFHTQTDENGEYLFEEIYIGTYTLTAEKTGYNSGTQEITIIENENTEADFSLTHPEFGIDTDELVMEIAAGDSQSVAIVLDNQGNGDLEFEIGINLVPPAPLQEDNNGIGELDEPWDELVTFNLDEMESRYRGATFLNGEFWVAGSNNADAGENMIYRYSETGDYIAVYAQPVTNHSSAGFYGITNDGTYLYGIDRGRLYQLSFTGEEWVVHDDWRVPIPSNHFITFDMDHQWIWFGNGGDSIFAFDLEGNQMQSFDLDDDVRGLAFYGDDPDGYTLYMTTPGENHEGTIVRKMNPEDGEILDVTTLDDGSSIMGIDISNVYNPLMWTMITVQDGGALDDLVLYEVAVNTRWISIQPSEGIIPAGETLDLDVTVYTQSLDPDIYQAWMLIHHNAVEQNYIIPMQITVTGEGGPHFIPVEPTGLPYAIIVQDATICDETMQVGDEIACFDGDLCVGMEFVNGDWPLPVVAWESGQEQPGYVAGHNIGYKVWDTSEQIELNGVATYIQGDGTFGFGPMSMIELNACDQGGELLIPLQGSYFELVSTNLIPDELNASNVFGDIIDLAIVYQDDGGLYLPPNINTIGDIDVTEAYQIFCYDDSGLLINGIAVDPNMEFALEGNRWNWIGYPFDQPVSVDVALSQIADVVRIVQNDEGGFWIPGFINTLGALQPGVGYFVFSEETMTFQYEQAEMMAADFDELMPYIAPKSVTPTGLPYVVLVHLDDQILQAPIQSVELFDNGLLVGKGLVDGRTVVPVVTWGGNEELGVPGFKQGNPIQLRLVTDDGTTLNVRTDGNDARYGEAAYGEIIVSGTEEPLPDKFAVSGLYPNPFNSQVTVELQIPESAPVVFRMFNVLGQQVFEQKHRFDAGSHQWSLNMDKLQSSMVTGLYFLRMEYQGERTIRKVLYLR